MELWELKASILLYMVKPFSKEEKQEKVKKGG